MRMAKLVTISLIVGLYVSCYRQNVVNATESLPDEHGIIMTTNYVYYGYGRRPSILRHLPVYPGYENTSVSIPQLQLDSWMSGLQSVDVDYATKSIYMYDYDLGSIILLAGYNKDLDESNMTIATIHVGVSKGRIQVAVDWLSHTIYWTDTRFRWIIAAAGQIEKAKMDYYKVIVEDHLEYPNGITLDPINGSLFWIDNWKHPKIECSDLMGGNRHTIITSKGGVLKSPISIEADIFEKRIYWLDSRTDALMTAKYDGSDINVIQRLLHTILTDLAIFRDIVLLIDHMSSSMYTLNKTLGLRKGMAESPAIKFYQYDIDGLAVYSPETQPQRDKDVCATMRCEQMCITTTTGATCVCADGYTKNSTGMCTEVYNKAIVYANATHICLVDIRAFANMTYTPFCIFTVLKQPPSTGTTTNTSSTVNTTSPSPTASADDILTMFDMNMEKRMLYFVSAGNTIYKRDMDLPITNDVKVVIVRASGTISGLAYDALDTNNLYWCESDTGEVKVVNVATLNPTIIFPANATFTNPRNVIVLLRHRMLAWIAGTTNSSIQTMTMDGKDVKVVYEQHAKFSSLVVDEHAQLFYFLSEDSIHSVMINGSNLATVTGVDDTAYKLLLYNGYMAWIYTTHLYNDMMKSVHIHIANVPGNFDKVSTIVDIKVLDTRLQSTNINSPCAYENGNCSQICITKYLDDVITKVCECKLGFTLDKDLSSCKTDHVNDKFIIVTDLTNDALLQIDLETDNINAIANIDNAFGVYFNAVSKRLVWSEYWSTQIFSAYLNGSDRQTVAELGDAHPYRFDMDMTTGNLYYTAYYSAHIGIVTPSGIQVMLSDANHWSFLGDIVVHPGKGWMFYTFIAWTQAYIARCNMDGTNVSNIIEGSHVDFPDGLAIDFKNDKLYWSDATYDTIQRCTFDGLSCTTIINITDTPQEIRDLVIDGDFLYYTAYSYHHVVRVDLQKPYNSTIVGQHAGLGKIDTMVLYDSSNMNTQSVSDACKDRNGLGDCSTICIPTSTGRKCACEEWDCLMRDERTCSSAHLCDPIIIQDASVTSKAEAIFIEESCRRGLNDECKYKCIGNSVPVKKHLTCTPVGWDLQFETLCQEPICDGSTLSNGHVQAACGKKIGEACLYQCDQDYSNTTYKTVCTKDLSWHPWNSCTIHLCDPTIIKEASVTSKAEEIFIEESCRRGLNDECKYKCIGNSVPVKKHLTCTPVGWDLQFQTLCQEPICDDSMLSNGHVQAACGKKIGEACLYQCDQDYSNTTYKTVCTKDLSWHPWNSCTISEYLVPQKQADDEGVMNGVIIGIVILAVVLILLVAGLGLFILRNMNTSSSSKHGIAVYSKHHNNAANEIPGDAEIQPPVNDTMVEQPSQMLSANASAAASNDGVMNYMYNQATLRDEEPWEETNDKVVLTNDSWFKEIQKSKQKKRF